MLLTTWLMHRMEAIPHNDTDPIIDIAVIQVLSHTKRDSHGIFDKLQLLEVHATAGYRDLPYNNSSYCPPLIHTHAACYASSYALDLVPEYLRLMPRSCRMDMTLRKLNDWCDHTVGTT